MAAPQTPNLRESVNAVPGAGLPVHSAAKVGNATIDLRELAAGSNLYRARGEGAEGQPTAGNTNRHGFALHVERGV